MKPKIKRIIKENTATTDAAAKIAGHVVETLKPGDIVGYEVIAKLVGYTRTDPQWSGFVAKFRKRLRNLKGWCIVGVNGVGYRILTPVETVTTQQHRRARKQISQCRMAKREAAAVRDSELGQYMQNVKYRVIEMQNDARKRAMRTGRILRVLTKPSK